MGLKNLVDDFCRSSDVDIDFTNALGHYTPCFVDTLLLDISYAVGSVFMVIHWAQMKTKRVPLFRQQGNSEVYQWCAFLAALCCLILQGILFGPRTGSMQTLISPDSSPAPFEYMNHVLCLLFWFLALMVLYRQLYLFTWTGLWTIRFSIVFVSGSQLSKFSFIVQPDLADRDAYYVIYMVYLACHLFLVLFCLTQFPPVNNLAPLVRVDAYEAIPDEESILFEADRVPERRSNILSRLTFSWMSPFLRQGRKRPLEFEDLWVLDRPDESRTLWTAFNNVWSIERTYGTGRGQNRWKQPSLLRTLWKTVGYLFLQAVPLKLVVDASTFTGPVFLDLLLDAVKDDKQSWKAYFFACCMFVGLAIGTIADNQHFQKVMRAGFQLRSIITTEVHRKSLFLTPTDRAKFSPGQIFNFVASDSESLQMVCQNSLNIISSPLRMIIATVLLFLQLGVSSLVAVATLFVLVPIQTTIVRWSAKYVKEALFSTDQRSKLEGELVSGIEAVKCNAWEDPFRKRIIDVRNSELAILWKSFVLAAINVFIVQSIPAVVTVLTFAVYTLLGNELTASKAFVSISLIAILQFPMFQLPLIINQFTQAAVSLKRLENFLKLSELEKTEATPSAPPGQTAVKIYGDFSWDTDRSPTLPLLDLDIPSGSLTAIVGPTGSGKSSILSAIVGLMQQVSGQPSEIKGTLSLVPQPPFIVNATVKDNILFGSEFDEARYSRAIQVANLVPDLEMLPGGDNTELGEKGVNISGGQKQRIAIARAVYSNPDICLLDDPLSALDSHVGRSVFNDAVLGALKGKTVVLVTNQLQYVNNADRILFMYKGKITEQGTYSELMRIPGGGFAQMMAETSIEEFSAEDPTSKKSRKGKEAQSSSVAPSRPEAEESRLIREEQRSVGVVSLKVIRSYIVAMGGLGSFLLLMSLFTAWELIRVGSTIWLTYWTNQGDDAPHGEMFYMSIYGGIMMAQVVFTFLSQLSFKYLGRRASRVLHENMVCSLIRAPMSFYHTTPVGRIINRVAKDTRDIDTTLVDISAFFLRNVLQMIFTLVLMSVVTPLSIPFLISIVILFYFLYIYFQSTAREVKRMDSISRSPIYSSINNTLAGLATIRAFSSEKRMIERHMTLVDDNIIMSLLSQSCNRWLSARLETLGALTALAASLLAVEQGRNPAFIGLTISYALSITTVTAVVIRLASMVEQIFNAVERVAEFGDIDQEAAAEIPGSTFDDWPDQGGVQLRSVKMSYRPGLPLVLRGLSAEIEPGQKVGVVGRTGAGKSSLINALFRTVELAEGSITIDGVDTSAIGLRQLRSKIAIIPQVPFVFSGTIRSNLDPFNSHSDDELWTAISRAHLREAIERHMEGLELMISEGGAPLSTGQVQLLSLARAIVRDTKILILDEATANVDIETDALIQQTIRREFKDKTIIAVAHRLHTIIDGDKVMVLDQGFLVEFDSPANLLRRSNGIFSSMVRNTGEATEKFLKSVAFGKVDMEAVRADDARHGLERVCSGKGGVALGWSNELVSSAHQSLKFLSALKSQLADRTFQRALQEESGQAAFSDTQSDFASSTLQNAMQIINEIEKVAHEAKKLLEHHEYRLIDPSMYGSPYMTESIGIVDREETQTRNRQSSTASLRRSLSGM